MTWRTLAHSTTVDSSDLNDNFYHVAQGTLEPLNGSTLTATTDTVDIGSSTTTWNTLYCNDVDFDTTLSGLTGSGLWVLESTVNLTSSATSVDFSGLNGDVYDYQLIMKITVPATSAAGAVNALIAFNQSYTSGDTSYGRHEISADGTSLIRGRTPNQFAHFTRSTSFTTSSETHLFCICDMNTKTGKERFARSRELSTAYGTHADYLSSFVYIWSNSSSTITSIHISSSYHISSDYYFNTDCSFYLFKRLN